MKLDYKIVKEDVADIKADILLIACREQTGDEKGPGTLLKEDGGAIIDKKLGGFISSIIREENFRGEKAAYKIIHTSGRIGAKKIILMGIGKLSEFTLDTLRQIGAKTASVANEHKARSVAIVLQRENIASLAPRDRIQAFVEGMVLGSYEFNRYKGKKERDEKTLGMIFVAFKGVSAPILASIRVGKEIAEAICYARDLVNMPGADMTPEKLAKEAADISQKAGLKYDILKEGELKKERMNLILAVSKGSANPPRLIHMRYSPAKKPLKRIAIIGKGITFDSGGYNLKPTRHIETMKNDMSGAAAVLAVMKLLPAVKPKAEIDAYIPAAENMIGGNATRPGDIIVSRSGKSVEITNTDAEGRLILADAIDYAIERSPDIIIDLATLTGGVFHSLGEIYTAILGNNQKLVDNLIKVSKDAGEPTWQLPLEKEYLNGFKEGIADLNNTGKTAAQTIAGALFLEQFVRKIKWAHLDIAASAWYNEEKNYRKKGGTGAGIQTLVRFLQRF